MKTLATYKREYSKAKTQKGIQRAMNRAMLNLSHSDQTLFLKWQISEMNKIKSE